MMSDVLTYALLCEEATWTYANKNDGTKLLVCRAYHARVWPGEFAAPSFSPGALLRHFSHIVQAEPIPLDRAAMESRTRKGHLGGGAAAAVALERLYRQGHLR